MENTNVVESGAVPAGNLYLGNVLRIPAVRQVMLLIGVAGAVAAGFAIAMWSQAPGYAQLYAELSAAEAAEVADALRVSNIDYKLDATSGNIMVPESSLHDARMQLAAQGLPQSAAVGMQGLADQSSFGMSQLREYALYKHALEAELGRTIASLGAVREARVHLGLPSQSSFIRNRQEPKASVFVQLFRGRTLEQEQASAVVNLVAASVPDLSPKNVTVVDQYGTLLSSGDEQSIGAQATTQFKYTRRVEENYKARIEDLLTPLVGAGRVRAEVVADIDFTVTEEARESYDPTGSVVRSEYINEDRRSGSDLSSGGVPGALSNQPPEASGAEAAQVAANQTAEVTNTTREATRNYEIDRTISHTKPQAGTIRRLSVAVLIDEGADEEGGEAATLTDAELERYTSLVREAVGFDAQRGDSVVVLGEAFRRAEPVAPAEPPAIWEKPIVRDVAKQALGAALVLAIAFGVVRPMLKSVVASSGQAAISGEYLGAGAAPLAGDAARFGGANPALAPPSFDEKVAAARNISGHDPARVAQVVKKWVSADG